MWVSGGMRAKLKAAVNKLPGLVAAERQHLVVFAEVGWQPGKQTLALQKAGGKKECCRDAELRQYRRGVDQVVAIAVVEGDGELAAVGLPCVECCRLPAHRLQLLKFLFECDDEHRERVVG